MLREAGLVIVRFRFSTHWYHSLINMAIHVLSDSYLHKDKEKEEEEEEEEEEKEKEEEEEMVEDKVV